VLFELLNFPSIILYGIGVTQNHVIQILFFSTCFSLCICYIICAIYPKNNGDDVTYVVGCSSATHIDVCNDAPLRCDFTWAQNLLLKISNVKFLPNMFQYALAVINSIVISRGRLIFFFSTFYSTIYNNYFAILKLLHYISAYSQAYLASFIKIIIYIYFSYVNSNFVTIIIIKQSTTLIISRKMRNYMNYDRTYTKEYLVISLYLISLN
jgi:hypothetical protein